MITVPVHSLCYITRPEPISTQTPVTSPARVPSHYLPILPTEFPFDPGPPLPHKYFLFLLLALHLHAFTMGGVRYYALMSQRLAVNLRSNRIFSAFSHFVAC